MLMERGVDVSYFTRGGSYLGHTLAESSGNIFLRLEQYRTFTDRERKLEFSRNLVKNKLENQMAMIREHRWDRDGGGTDYDWRSDIKSIENLVNQVPEKQTPDELRGLEGMGSKIYFRAFSKMVRGDFTFTGRNRRPPRDPVNALLSLVYAFLTREICSILEGEGLEPHLGFCHGIRYGRKSLALDLIEEFRQPIGDRLVLLLINKRMLTEEDFEESEEGGITLNDDGFRKFCTQYERWIDGRNSVSGERSFRSVLKRQVSAFRRMLGQEDCYTPYSWSNHRKYSERVEKGYEELCT